VSSMKVTGGESRGRTLKAPAGLKTRPTAARVREAVFNILGPPPEDPVLDLFAGSGALGIEALSRGASRAVFVERDGRALSALRRNLQMFNDGSRVTVVAKDVEAALLVLAKSGERFGWVFLDPPYAAGVVESVLRAIGCEILAEGAVVVVEHDKHNVPAESCGTLVRTDIRYYGDTGLSFYRCHGSLT